ncbi:MAG: hypothetical protein ACQSGP_08020 [Frankia sp.]
MLPSTSGHAAVADVLAKDEAYDQDPLGDPPVTVAGYRRALRAALTGDPPGSSDPDPAWEGREREAYFAGRRDALTDVVGRVALALGVGVGDEDGDGERR